MNAKRTGEAVQAGFYFNTRTWELTLQRTNGDALPGGNGDRHLRVPALALLFLGPMMGFFFVIFLPAIGFALTIRELALRVKGLFARHARAKDRAKTATL